MMKTKEILLLLLIALVIPFYVLWINAFPSFDYFLEKADNHGIMIKNKDLGENTFLLLPFFKNHHFSKVELKFKTDKSFVSDSKRPVEISVYENYEAVAYPIGGEINSSEEFEKYLYYNNKSGLPNGTFFSNGESVFFISRGQYRPVLSGEIFEKLGFSWEVIVPQETEIFSELDGEGDKIVFNSAHPDGIILKIDQDLYLVWEEQLLKIKNEEILKKVWSDFYTVSASRFVELDSCAPVIIEKKGEFKCDFDVSSFVGPNRPYIFKFNQGGLASNIIDAKVNMKVSAKPNNIVDSFMILLAETKEKLIVKYGSYLF